MYRYRLVFSPLFALKLNFDDIRWIIWSLSARICSHHTERINTDLTLSEYYFTSICFLYPLHLSQVAWGTAAFCQLSSGKSLGKPYDSSPNPGDMTNSAHSLLKVIYEDHSDKRAGFLRLHTCGKGETQKKQDFNRPVNEFLKRLLWQKAWTKQTWVRTFVNPFILM